MQQYFLSSDQDKKQSAYIPASAASTLSEELLSEDELLSEEELEGKNDCNEEYYKYDVK